MDEKITNSIALHQMTINELQNIKKNVEENIEDKVVFRVETKLVFRRWEPYILRCKNKLDISPYTMQLILDEAIKKERESIDKLIDLEIARKNSKKENK